MLVSKMLLRGAHTSSVLGVQLAAQQHLSALGVVCRNLLQGELAGMAEHDLPQ